MNYLKNQKGGFLIFEVVVLAMVLLAGGYAYYQYNSNKNKVAQSVTPKPHIASTSPSKSSQILLANGSVTLSVPKGWSPTAQPCETGGDSNPPGCISAEFFAPPGNPKSNIYGGNVLGLRVFVYQDINQSAKDWFIDTWAGSVPTGQDEVSNTSINGYNTYYYQQINNVYHEINYVFVSNNKAVLLNARVLEGQPDLASAIHKDDITADIPSITSIADSISIKP